MQSIANVKKIKNIFSVSRLYLLFFPIIYSGLLTKIMERFFCLLFGIKNGNDFGILLR